MFFDDVTLLLEVVCEVFFVVVCEVVSVFVVFVAPSVMLPRPLCGVRSPFSTADVAS